MANEAIIQLLDEVRRSEITASIQYMAHHSELENLGVERCTFRWTAPAVRRGGGPR